MKIEMVFHGFIPETFHINFNDVIEYNGFGRLFNLYSEQNKPENPFPETILSSVSSIRKMVRGFVYW